MAAVVLARRRPLPAAYGGPARCPARRPACRRHVLPAWGRRLVFVRGFGVRSAACSKLQVGQGARARESQASWRTIRIHRSGSTSRRSPGRHPRGHPSPREGGAPDGRAGRSPSASIHTPCECSKAGLEAYRWNGRSRTSRTTHGAHSPKPLGLGGGFRPTGVLVQRWVESAGPGRSPGRFFKRFLCDF